MSEWPMVKLGNITKEISSRLNDLDLPIYSVTKHNGFIPSAEYFKKQVFSENVKNYKLCRSGDFAYATIHLDEGSIGIAPIDCGISPMYTTFRIESSDAHPEFLLGFLKSYRALAQYRNLGSGSAERRKSINYKNLSKLEIPFPPLGEQKRIAEILGRVNYAIQDLESQIQFIESLPNKIFELFFNEESRQGKRPSSTIANFISNTQYGTSKKAAKSGAIPILRMGNITYSGQIDRSDLKYIDLADKEIDKYTLRDGDLLFNRTNSVELVGKTAVFEENLDQKVSYAGYLIRARTNADSNPYYVSGYLNSPSGKAQLRMRAKSIVGMANINAKEFLSLRIPAATKSEQDDFAHFYLECKSARKLFSQKLALLRELQRSLSVRAFAGLL
ncbi:restriction endonuclease subunit S [Corynebacterium durum]|uniref:restriction endonuclease subunit S n=1 Tax=Corynebacterium durum TaxID=61592 RepID=UPI0028EF4133|nr:restriction endonuclease subunit S [Corynebacterium durum]